MVAPRLCLALFVAAASAGCALEDRSLPPGHGVLVIAIDGLRADHLASFGYDRRTMPKLDELARDGVLFEHTFAAAPQRVPSHASLLTGSDPNLARRKVPQWLEVSLEQSWFLPAAMPRLGVEFLVGGAATAAFTDHPDLAVGFGFASGFQTFEPLWERGPGDDPGADHLVTRTLQWVRSQERSRDWLAYVHVADLERAWSQPDPRWDTFFEPRPEWDTVPPVGSTEPSLFAIPPSRFAGGVLTLGQYETRYDGALRRLDAALYRCLEGLDAAGRLEHTTIAVVGTYGVQFGEAGLLLDAGRLSVADLKVPFLLRPAPARFGNVGGRRVAGITSLIDVAPTLLDMSGHQVPRAMQGQSLWPAVLGGEPSPRRHAFASCAIQSGYAAFGESQAIEVLFFGPDTRLATTAAWYGDLEARAETTEERFYDWRKDPFPPLWAPSGLTYDETLELKAAAVAWVDGVEVLRRAVQDPGDLWVRR